MLKQFPYSVHFLGEEENIYFIKLSEHQDTLLYDRFIDYFPSLENELEILEYSYPEPDLVLSVMG
ncbi:MAG: hypothetical protein HeimC3_24820 [Candidatus Heimdallarchaeota archaeon LC_3]|nr:MAG: hypothetical protein HeimC3_24820 [Candidatus Heimdallarchaeota archaeon LC_3]